MGWFATAQALKYGEGPSGTVRQSLAGDLNPGRTLSVALANIECEIRGGEFAPDHAAKVRIGYWRRLNGLVSLSIRNWGVAA